MKNPDYNELQLAQYYKQYFEQYFDKVLKLMQCMHCFETHVYGLEFCNNIDFVVLDRLIDTEYINSYKIFPTLCKNCIPIPLLNFVIPIPEHARGSNLYIHTLKPTVYSLHDTSDKDALIIRFIIYKAMYLKKGMSIIANGYRKQNVAFMEDANLMYYVMRQLGHFERGIYSDKES